MTATGKTYGDALYDLAAEEALCDELLEQVKLLARLFRENPQYPALLASPDIPREERLRLIGEALTGQVHPYLVNFLSLLCERGRLPAFAGCAARYEQRWLEDHNTVRGRVSSAVPLTETQLTVLAAAWGKRWASMSCWKAPSPRRSSAASGWRSTAVCGMAPCAAAWRN